MLYYTVELTFIVYVWSLRVVCTNVFQGPLHQYREEK